MMKTTTVDFCHKTKNVNATTGVKVEQCRLWFMMLQNFIKFNFIAKNCSHILESIFSLPPNQHWKKS